MKIVDVFLMFFSVIVDVWDFLRVMLFITSLSEHD